MEKISRPFLCHYKNCPFRGASHRDLRRHLSSGKHYLDLDNESTTTRQQRHLCPVQECHFSRKGFARADHMKRHVRSRHPGTAITANLLMAAETMSDGDGAAGRRRGSAGCGSSSDSSCGSSGMAMWMGRRQMVMMGLWEVFFDLCVPRKWCLFRYG